MINKKFVSILFTMCLIFGDLYSYAGDDWGQFSRYEKENKKFIGEGDNSPEVIFIGNSITEGWAKEDPKFFTDNNFLGRGISGQTSYQMLVRFRDDVIELKPKYVVINAGTNDIGENNHVYNEKRSLGNIKSMAELAKANGIDVILTSVLPADHFPWRESIKDAPEKIKNLNQSIKEYADSQDFIFVNYYDAMATEGGALNPEFTYDGVHPNLEGYKVMEKVILPLIHTE